ncbi:serine hydrolase [Pseudoblastomonas halimionae]|uniref:Serine hydrolase n=1 Tax=Alteriqipengyuania halimionae TaxID=1926630 RepID=A0A6I4U3Z6_9SPHN|nr:serine hydrolase [Alteriqipengyuania halimionae]MXP09192.1 serine hydrolase [Alteriqipengyuania halimionae]
MIGKVGSLIATGALLALAAPTLAQELSTEDIEAAVLTMDDVVFDQGFNRCNIPAVEAVLSDDLEFYHDVGGIQDRDAFLKAFTSNICGDNPLKPIRRIVPDTQRVFPLYADGVLYGAIQEGDHNFYERADDGTETLAGSAAFTTMWLLEGEAWKMHRVLSYDHSGAESAGYRSPLFENELHIEAAMEMLDIPSMAFARIKGGQIQQIRVFGELSDGVAAPLDTIYNIASLTKPVTAMTTLKLVDAGLFDLDEPLMRYYVDPDVADAPELRVLTARHVLTHRTGFPNWRYLADDNVLRFQFQPGARTQYSGEGMEYLRRALKAKFGKTLEVLAQEQLFGPLGMKDTHFTFADGVDRSRYAQPHDSDGEPLDGETHTQANAADNLLTSARDYATFMVYVMDGMDLSPELARAMVTPVASEEDGIPFGLGWQIIQNLDGGGYALQHTGADVGARSIAVMYPETGDGILLLSNSANTGDLWAKLISESVQPGGETVLRRNLGN